VLLAMLADQLRELFTRFGFLASRAAASSRWESDTRGGSTAGRVAGKRLCRGPSDRFVEPAIFSARIISLTNSRTICARLEFRVFLEIRIQEFGRFVGVLELDNCGELLGNAGRSPAVAPAVFRPGK